MCWKYTLNCSPVGERISAVGIAKEDTNDSHHRDSNSDKARPCAYGLELTLRDQ